MDSRSRLVLCLAAVGGGLLRLWGLGGQPLWLDEMASLRFAERSFWDCVFAESQHPPLYRTMLWFFKRAIGDSDALLRVPSAVFGTATVASVCLLAQRYRPESLTRVAFLAATSPFLYYYSREGRNYALLILLAAWSTLAVGRILATGRGFVAYGLLSVLIGYTHYFGAFVLIAHELAYWRSGAPRLRTWLWMRGLSALAVLPWVVWLVQNLVIKPRDWILPPILGVPVLTLRILAGHGLAPGDAGRCERPFDAMWVVEGLLSAVVVLPLLWLSVRGGRVLWRERDDRVAAHLFTFPILLPLAVLIPLSPWARFLNERYLAFVAPFVLLLLGVGWAAQRSRRRLVDTLVVSVTLFALGCHVLAPGSLLGYPLRYQKESWPEAAAMVAGFEPETVVYCHDYIRPVFERYYGTPDNEPGSGPVERVALVLSHQSPDEEAEVRARWSPGFRIASERFFPAHSGIRVVCLLRR